MGLLITELSMVLDADDGARASMTVVDSSSGTKQSFFIPKQVYSQLILFATGGSAGVDQEHISTPIGVDIGGMVKTKSSSEADDVVATIDIPNDSAGEEEMVKLGEDSMGELEPPMI